MERTTRSKCLLVYSLGKRRSCRMGRLYSMIKSKFWTFFHSYIDTKIYCSNGASVGTLLASCNLTNNLICELTINLLIIFWKLVSGHPIMS
jgi:hypothetical protein